MYWCDAGHFLESQMKKEFQTCHGAGKWSEPPSKCLPCKNPHEGELNEFLRVLRPSRGVIHYYCNEGMKLSGNKERMCTHTGEWTGTTPTCVLPFDLEPTYSVDVQEDIQDDAGFLRIIPEGDRRDLEYAIVGGNSANKFGINVKSGRMFIVNSLDYETTTSYSLTVKLQHTYYARVTDTTTVNIDVLDMNDNPTFITENNFNLGSTAGATALVGTLSLTDSDGTAGNRDDVTITMANALDAASFTYDDSTRQLTTVGSLTSVGTTYDLLFSIRNTGSRPMLQRSHKLVTVTIVAP